VSQGRRGGEGRRKIRKEWVGQRKRVRPAAAGAAPSSPGALHSRRRVPGPAPCQRQAGARDVRRVGVIMVGCYGRRGGAGRKEMGASRGGGSLALVGDLPDRFRERVRGEGRRGRWPRVGGRTTSDGSSGGDVGGRRRCTTPHTRGVGRRMGGPCAVGWRRWGSGGRMRYTRRGIEGMTGHRAPVRPRAMSFQGVGSGSRLFRGTA
jgi:hypothetical protein